MFPVEFVGTDSFTYNHNRGSDSGPEGGNGGPGLAAGHSPETLRIDRQQQVTCSHDVTAFTPRTEQFSPGLILPSTATAPLGSSSLTRHPLSFQARASASSPEVKRGYTHQTSPQ